MGWMIIIYVICQRQELNQTYRMIKNFLKNNPIHKKIVPRLDYLMLLRPTLFFSVWIMICIGMYISSILSKSIEMNIVSYSPQTLIIFFGISLVCGSTFIINQLSDINSDKINNKIFLLDGTISSENALKVSKIISSSGFVIILLIDYLILFPIGIIFLVWGKLYNHKNYNWKSKPWHGLIANILCGYLLILTGMLFNRETMSISTLLLQSFIYCLPFMLAYSSIVLLANVPDENGDKDSSKNTFTVIYGVKTTVSLSTLFCLLSFLLGMYINEPLSSISSLSALPFFLFAFFRGKNKDIIRAIRYPIFLLHFYLFTVYPLLFFPIVAFYYLSKYYYWHRFNLHYPTLLVEND